MVDAFIMKHAHFPGRAPLDAYGNGGFRFADMSHRGSIVCLPSGIYGLDLKDSLPRLQDLEKIFEEADKIEVLLIGTGKELRPLPSVLRREINRHQISVDTMSTGAAVRTFNVLLAEDRAVAALLYAVE